MSCVYRSLLILSVVLVLGMACFANSSLSNESPAEVLTPTTAVIPVQRPMSDGSELMELVRAKYSKLKYYSADGESTQEVYTILEPSDIMAIHVKSHFRFDRNVSFSGLG